MIGLGGTWLLLPALVLDATVGDPDWLWRRLPHPVVLLGRLVDALDARLNVDSDAPAKRRAKGLLAALVIAATGALAGGLTHWIAVALPGGWLIEFLAIAVLLAQRSLYEHVEAVADAIRDGGLDAARVAVARIVGRDPSSLDAPGIARAAIESLAEGLCDGVVAPLFWYVVAGLPGMLAYKAINTADSMIGNRTPRYRDFGRAVARVDDVVNWPASRLAALLLLVVSPLMSFAATRRVAVALRLDARRHRSPNAGWPEAAMAAVLDVALAGPRRYAGERVEDAWMNPSGRRDANEEDIRLALTVYAAACALLFLLCIPIAFTLA
ncbi:MAG: adenosylcobinamide-phosphate synthase CbiB [Gammaproteobacteria bacterium]|nr:adenosylcobinamide-phosphate synthase CbiB [Gammaproteobacteria bacterium]